MIISLIKSILWTLLPLASCIPINNEGLEGRSPITITTDQATIIGESINGIDYFRGIPFAQPPVGDLRLRKPQPITTNLGTVQATAAARACPQMKSSANSPLVESILDIGEDCLTVTVQRPSSFSGKIPVVFWIFGGGFQTGASQLYDASQLIKASQAAGKPIMWVGVNYRLNGFGFLPGKQVLAEGIANLGILDQRMGLQWVADYISAFGGDPTKVTVWGESAGSVSVFNMMTMYNGNNIYKGKPLFRAAVMNSGSIVPTDPVDCAKSEAVFQTVVQAAGCDAVPVSQQIACLRSLDYVTYLSAIDTIPGILTYTSLSLPFQPRPDGIVLTASGEVLIQKGQYTKVPMIIGDQEDEGTLFALSQTNLTTTADLITYFQSYLFSNYKSAIPAIVNLYPDDPAAGSPFRTGVLNNIYPQYKRLAAMLGDIAFTLQRRKFLSLAAAVAPSVPAWSYLATYNYGTPILGTLHASDMIQIYSPTALSPISPANVLPPPPLVTFAQTSIFQYYVNFFNAMDPNAGLADSAGYALGLYPQWPQWGWGKNLLNFGVASNTILADDFRAEAFTYLKNTVLRT